MEVQTKKFYPVWFARKKIAKSVIATPLHHRKKTRTIYSNFFEPKNFKLSVYNLLIEFKGKQFLIFVERGKISRKK
jgi:hypothetical protein